MSQLPQMPKFPSAPQSAEGLKSPESEDCKTSDSLSQDETFESQDEVQKLPTLSYIKADESRSESVVPQVLKKGLEVMANRKGFYRQMRYKEGDKFVIKDETQLGDWMKLVDPTLERRRQQLKKEKKAKK